jgi:hypothetical protein
MQEGRGAPREELREVSAEDSGKSLPLSRSPEERRFATLLQRKLLNTKSDAKGAAGTRTRLHILRTLVAGIRQIERCNRLLCCLDYCKKRVRKGFKLVSPNEFLALPAYRGYNQLGKLRKDWESVGVVFSDVWLKVPAGRFLSFYQIIGARKGGYVRRHMHDRELSASYSSWSAKRDKYGYRC